MKQKTRSMCGLVGLLFLLFATGCGNSVETPERYDGYILDAANSIGLRIVRSDGADDTVIREALRIREYFRKSIGADVELVSDWKRSENNVAGEEAVSAVPAPEIVVGVTDLADDTEALQEEGDYYLLKQEGNQLRILATCETLLHDAVDRYINNYIFCENGVIYLSEQVDYHSSLYPFFKMAENGNAKCCIVLPNRAGEELVSAVTYIADRLAQDGSCRIPVIESDMTSSGSRCIWVCSADCLPEEKMPVGLEALPQTGKGIVWADENSIYVIGGDESGTVAAFSEFFAAVTVSADENGAPYLYFDRSQTIEASWNRKIPYLVGSTKQSEDLFSAGSEMLVFGKVDGDMLDYFRKRLLFLGLQLTNASTEGRGKQAFAFENAEMRLQLYYDAEGRIATMYLTNMGKQGKTER